MGSQKKANKGGGSRLNRRPLRAGLLADPPAGAHAHGHRGQLSGSHRPLGWWDTNSDVSKVGDTRNGCCPFVPNKPQEKTLAHGNTHEAKTKKSLLGHKWGSERTCHA